MTPDNPDSSQSLIAERDVSYSPHGCSLLILEVQGVKLIPVAALEKSTEI